MKQYFKIEIDEYEAVFAGEIQGILESHFDDVWVKEATK